MLVLASLIQMCYALRIGSSFAFNVLLVYRMSTLPFISIAFVMQIFAIGKEGIKLKFISHRILKNCYTNVTTVFALHVFVFILQMRNCMYGWLVGFSVY